MHKKRLLGIIFFSLLMLNIFSGVVSAQNTLAETTFTEAVWDPIKNMFGEWERGHLSINIAKYAFTILLMLLFYSVLTLMPFVSGKGKELIRFGIASIVAFLSTAYLTPSDIYTMLVSYGALGVVMGAVIPFIILLFFSIEIRKTGGAGGRILSEIIWVGFVLFLIWKIFFGVGFCRLETGNSCIHLGEGIAYILFIGFSVLWTWRGEKWFVRRLSKEEIRDEAEQIHKSSMTTALGEIASMRRRAQDLESAGQMDQAKELFDHADSMEKALGKK